METGIPIQNIYYLLCYAWERLDERDLIDVGKETPPKDGLELLGRVLIRTVTQLVRRGFERGYSAREDEIDGIRGRLLVGTTIRRNLPRYGRAACAFDELEHDTAANRIIKGTLAALTRRNSGSAEMRHEATGLLRSFRDVSVMRPVAADCRRVVIHRNNRHYGFALLLCEQILEMTAPAPGATGTRFVDFTRDHYAMARLFEKFVRNFYAHHRQQCGITRVSARQIEWDFDGKKRPAVWPGMNSDLCLERVGASPLVIDCKFYHDVVKTTAQGKAVLSSANLYQLFTYVQNLRACPRWESTAGLLLYAENGPVVRESHRVKGAPMHVATVNLNQPWTEIEATLIDLGRIE